MNKHISLIPIIGLVLLTLSGCVTTPSGAHDKLIRNSTSKTSSSNAVSNSIGATSNTVSQSTAPTPHIVEKTYPNSSDAIKAVIKVEQGMGGPVPGDPPLNLGLGIKASQLGGSGRYVINWTEGNWTIIVTGPSDGPETPKTPEIPIAKQVVAYLHTHMLPAPKKKGAIFIYQPGSFSNTATDWQSTIAWQKGNKVYQFKQDGKPLEALQTVVKSHLG